MDKFNEFLDMVYEGQAIAFLNAYWEEFSGEAEKVWTFTHKVLFFIITFWYSSLTEKFYI